MECIILSAGLSTRMNDWKQDLPYKGKTILDHAIQNALNTCQRIILVTGFRHDVLQQKYADNPNIITVYNPDFQQGMFSSIQCGVEYIKGDHFFITHGDMPCIDPSVFETLIQHPVEENTIVFPGNKKNTGHPVLLPKSVIPFIRLAPKRTSKMKSLLEMFCYHYLNLPESTGIFQDIDTPDDYFNLITQ
ncbi:hypothetical protein A6A19_04730 [Actinobacillus delphinicola]|uniref:Putative bifunctional molybdopterin-guanine dinucleotide biosynthesis protein MobA/MobB n=1 Tax=Actinobacillus delphinicola TaxID=51161 RepID=A0A448TTA8_9PAST|nr:NTP transferase domain-containing protein [Actinobacillus delphinicola]MDG6897312.1 hypothetical protein [Actinobacillus delphinicola]VEJ09135.1 putative bifunctional molybdopterin-guanine dinucleotide biosynthesis protein MobA/MobB [Actinobacillus delphinicola]